MASRRGGKLTSSALLWRYVALDGLASLYTRLRCQRDGLTVQFVGGLVVEVMIATAALVTSVVSKNSRPRAVTNEWIRDLASNHNSDNEENKEDEEDDPLDDPNDHTITLDQAPDLNTNMSATMTATTTGQAAAPAPPTGNPPAPPAGPPGGPPAPPPGGPPAPPPGPPGGPPGGPLAGQAAPAPLSPTEVAILALATQMQTLTTAMTTLTHVVTQQQNQRQVRDVTIVEEPQAFKGDTSEAARLFRYTFRVWARGNMRAFALRNPDGTYQLDAAGDKVPDEGAMIASALSFMQGTAGQWARPHLETIADNGVAFQNSWT